jgi:DNA-binding PadR family transcriptional regulator
MTTNKLKDSELLILGLIAEMPRHGYELEQVIEKRVMREWTRIGFSSIYYVLGKLEKKGLILADIPENLKARKRYYLSEKGKEVLVDQTLATIKTVQPTYPSLALGMIHFGVLTRDQALGAIKTRKKAVAEELERIENIHFDQQPLPDYVDAIFEFSVGQLHAEVDWINRTIAYMSAKTWFT